MNCDSYLMRLPDGRYVDARYQFRRGSPVRMMSGRYKGLAGTVESRVAQMKVDGHLVTVPGYHVKVDGGGIATVRWDTVEALK